VSRRGLVAFASSLDQVGPLARDVRDAALVLTCLAGHDPGDSNSLAAPSPTTSPPSPAAAPDDLTGLRVGVPNLIDTDPDLDPDIARSFTDSLADLESRGATILALTLPHAAHAVATYVVISAAEAASNLARYDGVRYGAHVPGDDSVAATRAAGFGREVQRRLLLGSLALRGHHVQAARVRALIARDYDLAFQTCDLLAAPVAPIPPFRRGALLGDPLALAMVDRFTVGPSLAGLPAIAVPAGPTRPRPDRPALPIGLQLISPRLGEPLLFRVAAALEPHA
jgi:aspartyl-tRNA(Asn)/glutamyl-tRNA(Gln) amidotransferase subunit A